MKVLVSPVSADEAASLLKTGVDIIDVKNVDEGSLGAQFPWLTLKVVELTSERGIQTSATLGDLPFRPGTAALAAYGAAQLGVTYIKAGLHGLNTYGQASAMMDAVRRAAHMVATTIDVVACGYADYRRFGGLNSTDLVRAAEDTRCDVVMLDTAIKDGRSLFDNLSLDEIRRFVESAKDAGLRVALAGSIRAEHADWLFDLAPDLVGVRGAVCVGKDRKTVLCPDKTREFVRRFHDGLGSVV